jgi:hypothetical protein
MMSGTAVMSPCVVTEALADFQMFVGLEPTGTGTLKAVRMAWVGH